MQILSIELAKISINGVLVEMFGCIVVWGDLDPLLNYAINSSSRDDARIIVEQGSPVNIWLA
jgi:hypothetical protein